MLGRFVIFVDVIRNNITDSETPIEKNQCEILPFVASILRITAGRPKSKPLTITSSVNRS